MNPSALISPGDATTVGLTSVVDNVAHGIVSRTVLATPELRVVIFSFAAEQGLSEHTSTSRAIIQVLSGECDFSVAGEARRLRPGELLHLPPGMPHAVRAVSPMTMLLTLAPPRPKA